ncbi:hypothetical protein EV121DRAFT_293531 [Schizophyllum commune]
MPEVNPQAGAADSKASPAGAQQDISGMRGHDAVPSTRVPAPQVATPRLIQPGPGFRLSQASHALDPRQPMQATSTAPIAATRPMHPSAPNAPVGAPLPIASASQPSSGSGGPSSTSVIRVAASSISPAEQGLINAFYTMLAMLVPQPLDASAYPITLGITLNGNRSVVWTMPRAGCLPTRNDFIIPPQLQATMRDPRTQSHISCAALHELWQKAEARAVALMRRASDKKSQLAAALKAVADTQANVDQLQGRVSGLQACVANAEQRASVAQMHANAAEQRVSDAEKRADLAHQRFADVDQRAGDAEKAVDALKKDIAVAEAKSQERREYALHAERVARAAQKKMRTVQACVVELEARQRERDTHAREVSAREEIVIERESQLLARETRLRARETALSAQEGLLAAREVEMKARPERVMELEGVVHDLEERIRVLQARGAELEQKVRELEARPRKKTKSKRH